MNHIGDSTDLELTWHSVCPLVHQSILSSVRRSMLVRVCPCWSMSVRVGPCWCWSVLVRVDPCWSVSVLVGPCQSVSVRSSICLFLPPSICPSLCSFSLKIQILNLTYLHQMCILDKIMYLNNLVKLSSLGCIYIDHRPTHIRLLNCTGNRQNTQMLQRLLLD